MANLETESSGIHMVNGDRPNNECYRPRLKSEHKTMFGELENAVGLDSLKSPIKAEKQEEPSTPGAQMLLDKLCLSNSECGVSISDLYKFALKFYKDKSGKAVHLTYEDNCHLVALSQQVNHGPYNPATSKTLGVLDVVGRDRSLAWQALGPISKQEAMVQFVDALCRITPTLQPYIQALWVDHSEKEVLRKEKDLQIFQEQEDQQREEEVRKQKEEEIRRQEEMKRQIQEALNQQTFQQFKLYAQQQYPGNPEQQAVLIRQLQEQHYQQYMQQVYQQQLIQQQQQQQLDSCYEDQNDEKTKDLSVDASQEESVAKSKEADSEDDAQTDEEEKYHIPPASLWTRRDIKEFKEAVRREGEDSIIKVGHGETVTVRVPTHEDGTCLFWEFATDSYDIGFGIFFEWVKEPSTAVSVHITESDEDDEDEPEEENEDIERLAAAAGVNKEAEKPPQSIVIPIYRRDCHEEVYAGSHNYPGTGVYLLKFDNSYSLWRSKMLYYRVYYTR